MANKELSRLLDAYQYGAIELSELQKRRQLVNSRLEMLNRKQELLTKMAAEQRQQSDTLKSLAEFASLVSSSLKRISFENKQKLLRLVLEKVVVKDWRVDCITISPFRRLLRRQNKKCQPNSICVPHVSSCRARHEPGSFSGVIILCSTPFRAPPSRQTLL